MTFIDFSEENIGHKGKYVFINRLESHREVGVLIHHLNRYFNNPETKRLSINIAPQSYLFSSLIVPLCSIFHSLKTQGKKITLHTESNHVQEMCILDPPIASDKNFNNTSRILDKIWKIENEYHLKNAVFYLRRFLGGRLGFDTPMLNALELAIIEAIENSLIHSETKCCFVMGQIHRKSDYFSLCVSDAGIGIRQSLEGGEYMYESEPEYLAASIKKGVTSKHKENYGGNGLYCLSRLAKINQGHFTLWSGESSIVVDGKTNDDRVYEHLPKIKLIQPSSHVDFQIPLNAEISADYDEVEYAGEQDDQSIQQDAGFNNLKIAELEHGYCTRSAGATALNTVSRFLDFPTIIGVVIDFEGIPVCSASFIDSFIGMLFKKIGEQEFNDRIRIRNATYEIRKTVYSVTNEKLVQKQGKRPIS
ncbi:MAG: DUF4325 domain-containing protein [Pseudomonadota bacterium]